MCICIPRNYQLSHYVKACGENATLNLSGGNNSGAAKQHKSCFIVQPACRLETPCFPTIRSNTRFLIFILIRYVDRAQFWYKQLRINGKSTLKKSFYHSFLLSSSGLSDWRRRGEKIQIS